MGMCFCIDCPFIRTHLVSYGIFFERDGSVSAMGSELKSDWNAFRVGYTIACVYIDLNEENYDETIAPLGANCSPRDGTNDGNFSRHDTGHHGDAETPNYNDLCPRGCCCWIISCLIDWRRSGVSATW